MKEKICFRFNIKEPSILFASDGILKPDSLKIQILTGRIFWVTRMHSSRMRTGRSLTVFQGLLFPGGCVPARGGVPAQGGCTCPGGVPAWGVYLLGACTCWGGTCWVCTCQGGVPARGYTCRGVYLPGGVPAWSGGVYLPGPGGVYLPGPGGGAWSGTPTC